MADVKLVAESLQEYDSQENLNESAKGQLAKFIKNPSKKKAFAAAYARQIGKTKGLKNVLAKMSDEQLLSFAKQSYSMMEKDPKLGYPWLKIASGKIQGAGALPVSSKSGIHKGSGID